MSGYRESVQNILRQMNPWWRGERLYDLPAWHRTSFGELWQWVSNPPVPRATLLTGPRQVGKTTLMMQAIEKLLAEGVHSGQILYTTFDHPLLKDVSLDEVLRIWREMEPAQSSYEFIFIDEIQYAADWQVWLKHQVDFHKKRRITVSGSAMPLLEEGQESGIGRWQTLRLGTLSFYEFLRIKGTDPGRLPVVSNLFDLAACSPAEFGNMGELARPLVGLFHDYLVRGGFPQCALVENPIIAQRLLREDIVDRVLRRDMTALYGVRRVLELEQTFLYLCLHEGGQLDLEELCRNLQVKKPTAKAFISLLESAHLIYKLRPLGYGKEVLRGRSKIYLADPAIASSVLMKGKSLIDDPTSLGAAVETACVKHLFARYEHCGTQFHYWKGKQNHEVDIVADTGGQLTPFEVKYRYQATQARDFKGLIEFCEARKVPAGFIFTREPDDIGHLDTPTLDRDQPRILKIPASLACYWLGQSERNETGLHA